MATLELTAAPGGENRLLSLRVTPEQEIAIYAFFQINGWTIITEEVPKQCEICQKAINGETPEPVHCQKCQKVIEAESKQNEAESQEQTAVIQQITQQSNQPQQGSVIALQDQMGRKVVVVGNTMTMSNQKIQALPQQTNSNETIIIERILEANQQQKADVERALEVTLQKGDVEAVPPKIYNLNNSSENRPYKCEDCGKHFRKKTHVLAHMKFHNGEALPKCDVCGKEFLYKHNLISHASIHSGERPYQCNACPKNFRRKDDLQIHMRTHTGERPYKCDICGKCFTTQNQLPKHKRTHTGEKPYQCTVCSKSFRTKPHLEKHHRTHSGERPYSCQECGRAFTQNAHLIAHLRTHTGEKPFECDECDKAFKESKTLKRHKLIHKNGMPFSCPICCKGFLRQQNLEVHMCVHSEDEPKYKRKLRLKREMLERLRAEDDTESGLHVDVSDDFTALNHDHMEMVKSRKADGMEELSMDSQNIIEEEVSGLDHDHLDIVPKEEAGTQKMSEENGQMVIDTTEEANQNSIASSLLTLVEMITSAEQGGAQAANVQQVQVSGDIGTQPSSTSSIITTAAVQGVDQKNILIPSSSQATGVIQNVISQGHSTEIGQADGLAQNIIITEVDSNDQQIIQTMTGQFSDGETYVVQYVQEDS
ncbi:zinc finger protein ZFP2-like [Ostrea edulis]|uniref:zinc finger protein ZFP2-like n=1 Tax=Ostrea edulis TaxID=37623 RepID=UPI00209559D5|nr:zinc finger protein ZFP2-like [Ostrea edulis]XP_048731387.1 zinc finger protein ZFP2-like [Ostrea edulis]XP_048731388.1 zinc finger protein ZFP2-like [Ostrea edulis]XP_048731389.1 zinc finger protein ZFP2-like [Ostrea edulis]XP_055998134.1 zinc finger protein ZFP2-like [Ostrea edulis]